MNFFHYEGGFIYARNYFCNCIHRLCRWKFYLFLLAQKEKREAKESEAQAKIYAENANKANLAAEKFYAEFSNNLEHQRDVQKEQELKEKIITFIALNAPVKTAPIAQHIGLSKEEAFDILHSMSQVDHSIHCAGQCDKSRIDSILWLRS